MYIHSAWKTVIQLYPQKPIIQLYPQKLVIQLYPQKPVIQLYPQKPVIQLYHQPHQQHPKAELKPISASKPPGRLSSNVSCVKQEVSKLPSTVRS